MLITYAIDMPSSRARAVVHRMRCPRGPVWAGDGVHGVQTADKDFLAAAHKLVTMRERVVERIYERAFAFAAR